MYPRAPLFLISGARNEIKPGATRTMMRCILMKLARENVKELLYYIIACALLVPKGRNFQIVLIYTGFSGPI